jgi:hypothetical protein
MEKLQNETVKELYVEDFVKSITPQVRVEEKIKTG